jgi:hypothetical protein
VVSLSDAVLGVAECPCATHQGSLVASLEAADQLILRVTESTSRLGEGGGVHVVGDGEEVKVATAVAPDGRSFLHAFTDLDAAQAAFSDAWFIGVAAQTAFRMAVSNGNQGIFISTNGGDDAWAAVTAEGIARLIKEPPAEPQR